MSQTTRVALQLSKQQLELLIPEGSEIEAELVGGVLANYADKISKRVADRIISSAREQTTILVHSLTTQANDQLANVSWDGRTAQLKPSVKQAIQLEASNAMTEQTKKAISDGLMAQNIERQIEILLGKKVDEMISGLLEKKLDDRITKAVNDVGLKKMMDEALVEELKRRLG